MNTEYQAPQPDTEMLAAHPHRSTSVARHRVEREHLYRIRILASLALSLLGITLLLNAPIRSTALRVGWNPGSVPESIEFSTDRSIQAIRGESGVTSSPGVPVPEPPPTGQEDEGSESPPDEPGQSTVRPMRVREAVYDHVESPPEIRGGLGSYYINIEYPPEAVALQIEGRLVLRFVVGTDGRAREILVIKSLHALCDSAAVRALRETTFVPGRQQGKKVPVRMQLPVRFQLVGPSQSSSG